MKKVLKNILSICIALLACIVMFTACDNANNDEQKTMESESKHENGSGHESGSEHESEDAYVSATDSIGLAYKVNSDGSTCTITGIGTCTDTEVHIPSKINGYTVTNIDSYAFIGCSNLTSIVIPNSVMSIDHSAFSDCSRLTSIVIPNSVKSIGDYAFANCYKLVEVYNLSALSIKKGGYSYGYVGFYALNIYTSITESSKLWTDDNGYIFYEDVDTCYLLGYTGCETDLTLPANCNGKNYAIYKYAFYRCSSLMSITIPSSVMSIGNSAFYNCRSLTSVMIPNGIASIGDWAFCYCSSLLSITISSSVTSIGEGAFRDCRRLTYVFYDGRAYDWYNINMNSYDAPNDDILYFYSEIAPGNHCWHYVDGVPTVWES